MPYLRQASATGRRKATTSWTKARRISDTALTLHGIGASFQGAPLCLKVSPRCLPEVSPMCLPRTAAHPGLRCSAPAGRRSRPPPQSATAPLSLGRSRKCPCGRRPAVRCYAEPTPVFLRSKLSTCRASVRGPRTCPGGTMRDVFERGRGGKRPAGGITRRDFGRLAALLTTGAALPFYNELALAQDLKAMASV